MGKKKTSLKPVQRGFATTSVISKKAKEEAAEEARRQKEAQEASAASSTGPTPGVSTPAESSGQPNGSVAGDAQAGEAVKEDWEDEHAAEEAVLQVLVDRLHDKGEKEVTRILKAIEYDKRFAGGFPRLQVNEAIRDRVLDFARQEKKMTHDASGTAPTRSIPSSTSSSDSDKLLLRLFVAYHVLQQLGFSEGRISQCLLEDFGESDTWEDALEWMWLHLSEDECLSKGEYAKPTGVLVEKSDDEPLLADEVPPELEPAENAQTPSPPPPPLTEAAATLIEPTSLFQSLDSKSASDDDSDVEPDLQRVNADWAQLMLELDNLRIGASDGGAKGKGKKGKSSGVVLETPEMRNLKEKITKVEKDYMFSRRDADVILKAMRSKRNAEALEARLKGRAPREKMAEADDTHDAQGTALTTRAENMLAPADGESEQEEEDNFFGNMLDDLQPLVEGEATNGNTIIAVRSMAISKQFSFSGNLPKSLLRASLTKSAKTAVITYARLSGGSRAARVGLEIRWTPSKRKVWRMEDIACESMTEAENYVSTLALHELAADGAIPAVNWRTMPPMFRELWEELDTARKERDDIGKREVWSKIKGILEAKTVASADLLKDASIKPTPSPAEAATPSSRSITPECSNRLQVDFERRRSSTPYQMMLKHRSTLPIASFREEIVNTLEKNQIMVLSGETGCGKSTQLPSFILEDQLAKGRPCRIFVTEPRRISAISLAQRVSQELGDAPGAVGTNNSLVGYSIRLEAKVAANTRLAFVTNGIALRMLESGSGGGPKGTAFDEVTHIIIDEVHERSIESDFLLIVLKSLMQQRPDLKIVLMSATVDAEKISTFFGGCPFLSVPGRTFPVQVNYLEDAVQTTQWHIDESSPYAIRARNARAGVKQLEWTEEGAKADDDDDSATEENKTVDPLKLTAAKYSARTVETVNLLDSRQIPYDLIVRLLERICFEDESLVSYSAATLVFMPGLAEIRKLHDMLQGHPAFGTGHFVIHPLHSTISSEGQSAVFDLPPPGVRKIVISTNIAETGVTIPDITCVIDSGKHREMRYDEKRQISRLVETYIARSNAKQRRGRAGRVQEGLAFHMFTKARHDTQLAEHPVPEMLRLSLQDLALRIKILRLKLGSSIEDVLLRALDPPSSTNIQRAIASLVEVKALTPNEEITPMGRLLSKLPMDVHLGKFLLVAAMWRCIDPALTIAATLNSKSPFITPFGFEGAADAAKRSFAVGNSDFLTIANVFASWRRASDNPGFVRTFCKRNFVSQQNLQQIEELRQQLLSYLIDSNFVEVTQAQKQEISQARYARGFRTRFVLVPPELNANADNVQILGAALAAGLYPKLLSLDQGGMKTIINQQPVTIHPSSVNFRISKSEFGTTYLAYFTIIQSKRLYAWETGPVDDRALALLCGDQADFRLSARSLQIDRKIRYSLDPKTAIALKILREQVAGAMGARLRGKACTKAQGRWWELAMGCLTVGTHEDAPGVGLVTA